MPRLELLVIDHYNRDGLLHCQPPGKIIQTYVVYPGDFPGTRYADFCALYNVWTTYNANGNEPDLIGFFGYRKYLAAFSLDHGEAWLEQGHAPNWYNCGREHFDEYRQFLSGWDGGDIKRRLAQYDILQAAPFPLDRSVFRDFSESRSMHDGQIMNRVLTNWVSRKIYQYHFITRWSVFDRMMREVDPIRQKLDPLITAEDSINEAYKQRPMAYVMERVYSNWLQNSGLSIKELPVLHCWDL